MITKNHLIFLITVLISLTVIAILDREEVLSQVSTGCMDATERENIRSLVLQGINDGLSGQIEHLFETWMKDLSEQPKRATAGTNNAVNAYIRARKQILTWNPPTC